MHEQAVREYQETTIQTGSPVKLVSMLYDGALRFIAEARAAIETNDIPTRADRLRRATRIVQELNNALEHSVESDIPERLSALYDYVEYELLEATTRNHVAPLDNATRVLRDLAEAWHQLAAQNVAADTAQSTQRATPTEADPEVASPAPAPMPPDPTYSDLADEARRVSLTLSA